MSKLSKKVALVTGASKGIGAAIAEHLAADGAAVAVNYARSQKDADAVVKRIKERGGKAIAVQGDVSKLEDIQRVIAETESQLGKIDILVNNAGVYEFAPLEAVTPEHFHKQFNLNVLGLLLTTQEAVKRMNGNGGSVINISSIVGQGPIPHASVYSATKAAVDAITVALSRELGSKKIRVNSVSPGLVDTDNARALDADGNLRQSAAAQTLEGRVGLPEDIARTVAFFASDDAGWVTGQNLIVAGGQRT